MDLVIAVDDPCAADVSALVQRHLAFARKVTPAVHVHALGPAALADPAVTFYSARGEGVLLGVAALRRLDPTHAELKSMHTSQEARNKGIGCAMLYHLLAAATALGYERVSLETGATEAFAPARRLYERAGFRPCEPFGEHTLNPYSTCLRIELADRDTPTRVTPRLAVTARAGIPASLSTGRTTPASSYLLRDRRTPRR